MIFGSNYGASSTPLRPQTLPYAENAGITVLRYPGGAWGDQNNLQAFQIDQFAGIARFMGAEPYIHVRFTGGSPEQAASYVKYAKDQELGIKYWSIGNEPSLYEAAGDGWTAEEFAAEWRKFADAMRAADPSIVLIGPEIHQFNGTDAVDPKDSTGKDWLRTFLQANGDAVDIVSVHRYPFPNNAEKTAATPAELLADAATWNDLVRNLKAIVREETGKDLPVAITEFNSHWTNSVSGETTPDSFLSALWLGDVVGRLVNEQVTMANQFLLTSGGENGFGLLSRTEPRPGYYVYQLYKQMGDQLVASSSPEPAISTVAALREDGALTLMLTNTGAETVTLPIQIAGFTPQGDAEVWRFDAEHNAEQVENTSIADGAEVALPPRSMTLVVAK
ncbi:MAG: hypothetical protein IPK16_06170 [Anaerolineales bacterium]|nr:hypothetical protein [Anaerolineales bacterium]